VVVKGNDIEVEKGKKGAFIFHEPFSVRIWPYRGGCFYTSNMSKCSMTNSDAVGELIAMTKDGVDVDIEAVVSGKPSVFAKIQSRRSRGKKRNNHA
jgi:hypothetical protein